MSETDIMASSIAVQIADIARALVVVFPGADLDIEYVARLADGQSVTARVKIALRAHRSSATPQDKDAA